MNILYVVHANPWVDFSGAPLVAGQYALAAHNAGWNVGIMTPDLAYNRISPKPNSGYAKLRIFHWGALNDWTLQAFQKSPEVFYAESPISWPHADFVPDIVHIVDWVGISPSLLRSLKALNIPIIRHICNFEDICHFIEPIHKNSSGTPCVPPLSPDSCGECVANKASVSMQGGKILLGDLKRQIAEVAGAYHLQAKDQTVNRQAVLGEHLSRYYDHLIFPSQSFYDYWQSFFKNSTASSIVPHGCSVDTRNMSFVPHQGLNCIYVGGTNYRKGWDVVEDVFSRIFQSGSTEIRLRVYGNKEFSQQGRLAAFPQVEFFDAYSPDRTAEVLSWADVGIVPTRFETYCRVVREMMICGVIPVASSAFGIPDVLQDGINGLLIEPEMQNTLMSALDRLVGNPELVHLLKSNAQQTIIDTPADECRTIQSLYRSFIPRLVLRNPVDMIES